MTETDFFANIAGKGFFTNKERKRGSKTGKGVSKWKLATDLRVKKYLKGF